MASLNDHETRIFNIEKYKSNVLKSIPTNGNGTSYYYKLFKMVKAPGNGQCQISFISSIESDLGINQPKTSVVSLSTRNSNRIPSVVTLTGNSTNHQWFTTDDGSNIWLWFKSANWQSDLNLTILTSTNVVDLKQEGWFEKVDTEPEGAIYASGNTLFTDNIRAEKVYNAVWNDYAEFFERGEETEVGDIIALDENSDEERYIKATNESKVIVGVHSDTFAHLIGGENPPEGEDFYEYNIKKFIPVGLAGRVKVKVIGPIKKGDLITVSPFDTGIGISINNHVEKYGWCVGRTIGQSLENKDTDEIGLIKILIIK